jgi:TonB-dependent receptor
MPPDGAARWSRFCSRLFLFLALLRLAAGAFAAEPQKRAFDIAAGNAAETLKHFATQADREIMFPVEPIAGVRTHAIRGRFAPREALERMIERTGLTFVEDVQTGAFMVKRAAKIPGAAPSQASDPRSTAATDNRKKMTRKNPIALLGALLFSLSPAQAQSADTGVITGRVFNPNTGEYVRNAQVRVEETGLSTISEGGGEYRLAPVPAGKATLVVTYTGYRTAGATVTVAPGATVSQDFNLVSSLDAASAGGETVKLAQFVVSSEREGAAKAIMDQRNSMNITNTVASDTFGDNAEGNIGEFLKHLPGVELDLFYGEVRTVRLGGLSSEYTSVTMDGIALASADANNSGSNAGRSFTMEMASLNSMESIEVSKTISADVDANAPAGTINLRTKRAFDRAGRRVSWQANVTAHSEAMNFNRSLGPDEDHQSYKLRPGGIFEYSDVFLNKRLGVVLNISESNVYQEALISTLGYAIATNADPRPATISSLNFQWAPRFNKRFATTLTTDYKISPTLNVGLGVVYNYVDLWTPQRTVIFNSGTRASVDSTGTDPLLSFTSASNGSVQVNPVAVSKMGETLTLLPRLAYKRGNLDVEAKVAYTDSTSWYDPLGRRDSIRDTNTPTASNITYRAVRSSPMDLDWKFTQIAGNDIASGASFTNPALTINDGRFARTAFLSGEVNAVLKTAKWLPIVWKSGLKSREQLQKFEDDQLARRFIYAPNGVTAAPGAWAPYRSPWEYSLGMIDGNITSISGANVFMPNLRAIADLYRSNPAAFRQDWGNNSDNYYQSYVARRRRFYERIDAGYLMGTTSLRHLTFRAGLRWEGTHTYANEANPHTPSEVQAAGFPVNTAGVATTIPGIDYQFLSRPRINRTGDYDNLFPSASVKYNIARNFDVHLGYSSTIRRPAYYNLAGVWTIDETARQVRSPNPRLKPETADNYAARFAYYFEPVGQLAATFTQRNVTDLIFTNTLTAQEFGYTGDDDLASYEFVTYDNSVDRIKIRSMELEYSQSLAFLGELFKRLSVRGSYTRLYPSEPRPLITPHLASGGINYTLNRLNLYVNWNWSDDVPRNVTGTIYDRHRSNLDAGGSWRLTNHYSLAVSARNLTNTPYIRMQRLSSGPTVMTRHEIVGTSWTFAIKATY